MEEWKNNDSKDYAIKTNKTQEQNISKNNIPQNNKSNLKIILIINISFFILIIVFIIVYLILSNKSKKIKKIENHEIIKIEKKNYIEASFKVEEGKEISIINPNEINLNHEDYYIELIDKSDKNIKRNLKIIETQNGFYKPEFSGILTSKIIFNKNLNSLNEQV